jgi:dimethylargininase
MVRGLTSANLGLPDYDKAVLQHKSYVSALERCGLDVFSMEADENFSDSVFVEDVALLTPEVAIITYPGAESRRGEILTIQSVLHHFYEMVERIIPPGQIEAGDIMKVGTHYYIGLSGRTNREGARQMINILNRYGMTGSTVILHDVLHLKTGLSYLENNNLLVAGDFSGHPDFIDFNVIPVSGHEAYAANSVWINGRVLVAEGFPQTRSNIAALGYEVIELDVSEFRKLDGGLSCLSLRF